MAPVLLCPECGAKHPLDKVGGASFPCTGCGRTLKVPQQVRAAAAVGAPPGVDPDLAWPEAVPRNPTATTVLPKTPVASGAPIAGAAPVPTPTPAPVPIAKQRASHRAGPVDPVPAAWIRFALWIVAVPLGFVIVFALAQIM